MNGLEAAIKNALARSDRTSAETRARIYQSSREALEAGLRKQNIDDPDVIAQHRQRLEHLIRIIEHDERERLLSLVAEEVKKTTPPPPPPAPLGPTVGGVLRREPQMGNHEDDSFIATDVSDRSPPRGSAPEPVAAPVSQRADQLKVKKSEVIGQSRSEPTLGVDDDFDVANGDVQVAYDLTDSSRSDEGLSYKPEPVAIRKKRRGFVARLMILFTFFAFLVLVAAWVYSSGLLISAEERDQSVPNPPAEVQEEDFNGDDNVNASPSVAVPDRQLSGSFSSDWLNVFDAATNFGKVRTGTQVDVENVTLPSGKALKVTSRSGGAAGEIQFEVPIELMRQLNGHTSTIAVTLQSSTDTPTQVSIDCNLKSLGNCSRHRFTAMPERADMLINTTFTGGIVPNDSGLITLNADLDGEGKAVNIYAVRILPSE